MKRRKLAGINFDHFHMGDNLQMALDHPQVDIVGICDEQPDRMQSAQSKLALDDSQVFTDYAKCIESTKPDIVLLCPSAAEHGLWTKRIAPFGVHLIVEKPFAASLAEADEMIAAVNDGGGLLSINWPMTWYHVNITGHRLIREGRIGEVMEVHYYDGNRGPLWHTAGKEERTREQVNAEKPNSWFYSKQHGGGSLLDYLAYGTTLATWFNGGRIPTEVVAMADRPQGLEVDEHSITVARYREGLSKFETRWGTYTDPWTHQPQPKCGFVIVGSEGTVSCYDYEETVLLQSATHPEGELIPVDVVESPNQNPVQQMVDALETGKPIDGPNSIETSRIGQLIVDAAVESIATGAAVAIPD